MQFIRKYGTAFKIRIPVVKAASSDFAVGADWTPATGDVKISKDGGGAANITTLPTAIAMGNGAIWEFAVSATEAQAAEITITVVDSATKVVQDQALSVITFGNASAGLQIDWSDAVRLGLTALPNAAAGANAGLPLGDASGCVGITSNIKKNTAKTGFLFVMTDSANHVPTAGLTVTATRSIDGGAFASTTNSPSAVATGTYKIDLSAADMNGDHIALRFTATAADDLNIEIITQP